MPILQLYISDERMQQLIVIADNRARKAAELLEDGLDNLILSEYSDIKAIERLEEKL